MTSGPAAPVTGGAGRRSQEPALWAQSDAHFTFAMRRAQRCLLFQRIARDRKKKDETRQRRPVEEWRHRSELDGRSRSLVAREADHRHGHPGSARLQRKSRYAKTMRTDNATWGDVPAMTKTRASRQRHDLFCLPLVVGDELFWLSSFDAGESQDAESPQRRRRLAQLHAYNFQVLAR